MAVASLPRGARRLLPSCCPHRVEALRVGRTVLPRVDARLGVRAVVPGAGT